MEIRAYSYDYLRLSQRIMGDTVDFAVNTCGFTLEELQKMLLNSKVVIQFQNGNCKYIAGVTGCELFRMIACENGHDLSGISDIMYLDKSKEYWCGFSLAFYQWYSSYSFSHILSAISLMQIADLYYKYHEMDIMQFVDHIDSLYEEEQKKTRLKRLREYHNLSQSGLAKQSGVALRQIQLFEQRNRDINKTQADTLFRLSEALHCDMKDLLE